MLPDIYMELNADSTVKIDFDVGIEYGQGGRLPDYHGSYEVVIKEVPVARVSNPSGGKTCTICAL